LGGFRDEANSLLDQFRYLPRKFRVTGHIPRSDLEALAEAIGKNLPGFLAVSCYFGNRHRLDRIGGDCVVGNLFFFEISSYPLGLPDQIAVGFAGGGLLTGNR